MYPFGTHYASHSFSCLEHKIGHKNKYAHNIYPIKTNIGHNVVLTSTTSTNARSIENIFHDLKDKDVY